MKITFCGANRTVTGSKHLIEVNGTRILLDCGMFQGRRAEADKLNREFAFDPKTIDLLVLSHAHIDHSGNIPNLVKSGFKGDIISTPATRDLCAAMLPDSGHIQERDVEFVNKRRKKRGEPPIIPLYTQQDAYDCLNAFTTQNYHRTRTIAPGVQLTFLDAGHMLGSAIVALDIVDREANREVRFVFSGDIGRKGIPIIRDPEFVDEADILIMESTYGGRFHETYEESENRLEHIIRDTYHRGGSVIMPAFAVGRTQQLVLTLHQLSERGDIPRMPIYVDSPLAVDTTSIFRLHPECYDEEIRTFMNEVGTRDPFGFTDLTYIRSLEDSKRLNFIREPMIIISASGMAEFGRVLHHLANRIQEEKTTVLITGWQAEHTLGRRLVEKVKTVRIFGDTYQNNAHIEVINGFSGHADQNELTTWVGAMKRKPRRMFLVHGEEEASNALKQHLETKFNLSIEVPVTGQIAEV